MVNATALAHRHFYFATFRVLFDMFHYVGPLFYRLKSNPHKDKNHVWKWVEKNHKPSIGNIIPTEDQAVVSLQWPACGRSEQIIWVHGHGKWAHCHTNVMPCCDGSVCEDPSWRFFVVAGGKNLTWRRYSLSTCKKIRTRYNLPRNLVQLILSAPRK